MFDPETYYKPENYIPLCAFCGCKITPNYFNACDECYEAAQEDPDEFINQVLE